MSLTITPASQHSLPPGAPVRRRRGRVVLAALGLAVAGGAGWWLEAGERLDDVHVLAAPDAVRCSVGQVDRDVPGVGDPRGPGYPVPVVQAVPGMACLVSLLVVNESGSAVTLERVVAPGLGPSTRGAVRVPEISPYGPSTPSPDGYDAVSWTDPHELVPGEVWQVSLVLAYNEDGCSAARTVVRPVGPLLEVRALGRSAVRASVLPTFAYSGAAAGPDCPSG